MEEIQNVKLKKNRKKIEKRDEKKIAKYVKKNCEIKIE